MNAGSPQYPDHPHLMRLIRLLGDSTETYRARALTVLRRILGSPA
jgi:hypothetical protein